MTLEKPVLCIEKTEFHLTTVGTSLEFSFKTCQGSI